MTLGEKIKARRKELGLTQTDLAVKLKTTKQTIGKYESGIITNIPLNRVVELAAALDCLPEYLTGWDSPEDKQTAQDERHALVNELFDQLPPEKQARAVDLLKWLSQSP